jgi:hypothetical protein
MANIFINKKVWNTFTPEQLDEYVEDVFNHYRKNGFPYFELTALEKQKELQAAKKYDFRRLIDHDNKVIGQSMHGLGLAWSYMPHSFSVQCGNAKTPMEVFNDDELLRKVIRKRISMGDNMSDNGLRKMLKLFTGTQAVSNFRPTAAAAIYHHFRQSPEATVWDMSCGYGGRLLGAMLADVKYIGTDPCKATFNGLTKINQEFYFDAQLHNMGSECFLPEVNSLDICFTSPPYFDWEKYSDEPTQSYIKYPTKDLWVNEFMGDTLSNCYHGLKQDGVLILNIANTKRFTDLEERVIMLANSKGFKLVDTWKLALSNPNLKNKSEKYKCEPIYIFNKE